ncbi:fibronectin type III domain-containing protein, partial [Candidatus Roizmanbacteria bacterium]|nr:fibronectin type III domain-containing protein [Candidatus Roizmanbacteria bacterium]
MTYSNIYIRSQNKSSFFLVVLAALSIFSFSVFYFGSQSVPSRASKKTVKKLQIVNLYINQAGIYWQSELKEFGWIIYGKQKNDLQRIALDERDSEQKRNKFSHHLVLLRDLDKNTTYYYKIIAGNEIAVKNNGEPYSFKTPQSPISNTQLKPLYGKVMLPNGQPASNALALLYYKDMVPLATVVKTTGEWLLPLQSVIDSAFSPLSISENDWVTMQILSEESEPAIIEAPIKKMTPVSNTIITGKTYRFTDEDTNVLSSSTKQSNENYADIDIVLPREGTIVPAVKPLLKGIALPKQEVDVSLDSRPPFSKRIITDEKGEWKLTLPIALLANSY